MYPFAPIGRAQSEPCNKLRQRRRMSMSRHNNDMDNVEPVAGLSAAASCIKLTLCLDDADGPPTPARSLLPSFLPVYTHQCFPEEFIPGWRPLPSAEKSSHQVYQRWKYGSVSDTNATNGERHSSYKKISDDQQDRLNVNVLLSPSCDRCKIEIQTTSTPQIVTADEPATKKTKREAFQVNDEVAQHLSVDEVIKQIQSSVPPVVTVTIDGSLTVSEGAEGDNLEFEHLYRPIGSVLKSYNREIKYNNDTMEEGNFVITLARGSDQSVALYHNAIQPLARWFIETADDVNVSDEDSGFWSVLYLFRKHDKISRGIPTPHYSLAGYITLFHFNAPFKKPYPGVIVRVCQALILPPYQRSGHGSELLLSVHDYAEKYINNFAVSSNGMDIVEVNVEDPAPGFVALRDITDYQRLLSLITEENDKLDMKYIQMNDVTSWEYFQPAPDEVTLTLSSLLKVTKRQAEIVQEIHKLATVEKWKKNSKDKQLIQQVETNYRLMIKKSLKSFRTEELGACEGGKEGQKALLAKWFAETHSHYLKLLGLV